MVNFQSTINKIKASIHLFLNNYENIITSYKNYYHNIIVRVKKIINLKNEIIF